MAWGAGEGVGRDVKPWAATPRGWGKSGGGRVGAGRQRQEGRAHAAAIPTLVVVPRKNWYLR